MADPHSDAAAPPARRRWLEGGLKVGVLAGAGALAGVAGYAVHRWGGAGGADAAGPTTTAASSGAETAAAGTEALWAAQLSRLDGAPVRFASFRGQPLVVNFWASWCGPCLEEMPDFQKASQTEAGLKVTFVGIGIDYAKNMRPFADKLQITYTLLESGAQGLDLVKAAGNSSGALPFTLFLDRQGRAVGRKLGKMSYAELMTAIAAL